MKKNLILLSIFLVLSLLVSSCSEKQTDELRIGFSMATLTEERWIRDRDCMIKYAKENGCSITVQNANESSEKQFEDVKEMISEGIDILVIVPQDKDASAIVNYAKKRKVRVVSYDRLAINSNIDAYVSFDSEKVGELQAEEITKINPSGKYLVVSGPMSDNNSRLVREGVEKVLKGNDISYQMTQVSSWDNVESFDIVNNILSTPSGKDIQGIICANDSLAYGASNAAFLNQRKNMLIAGQDADLEACRRIVSGKQTVTIYKPIDKLACTAIDICKKLYSGEELDSQNLSFENNGYKDIPTVLVDVYAVNKDNIKEVLIDDNYYSYQNIYGF